MTECCCKKNSPAKWQVEWPNPYRPETLVSQSYSQEELENFILRRLMEAKPEDKQRLEWSYYTLRGGSLDELRVNMAASGYYVEKL